MGFDFTVIAPLLPSHCGFFFVFGCGVSFLVSSSVFLSMIVHQLFVILVFSHEGVSGISRSVHFIAIIIFIAIWMVVFTCFPIPVLIIEMHCRMFKKRIQPKGYPLVLIGQFVDERKRELGDYKFLGF